MNTRDELMAFKGSDRDLSRGSWVKVHNVHRIPMLTIAIANDRTWLVGDLDASAGKNLRLNKLQYTCNGEVSSEIQRSFQRDLDTICTLYLDIISFSIQRTRKD